LHRYCKGSCLALDGEWEQIQHLLSDAVIAKMTSLSVVAVKLPAGCSLVTQANDLASSHRTSKKLINNIPDSEVDQDIVHYLQTTLPSLYKENLSKIRLGQFVKIIAAFCATASQAWRKKSVLKGHVRAGWADDEISFSNLASNGWVFKVDIVKWEKSHQTEINSVHTYFDAKAECSELDFDSMGIDQTPKEKHSRAKGRSPDQVQLNHRRALIFYTQAWVEKMAAEKKQREEGELEKKVDAERARRDELEKKAAQVLATQF
jgi:hypothetical protein